MYHWYEDRIKEIDEDLETFDYYLAHGLKKGIELSDLELKSQWPMPKFHGKKMSIPEKLTFKDRLQAKRAVYKEILSEVDRHLERMNPVTRAMVEDHFMEGVSIQVIANRQNMKEDTAKKRIFREIIKVCP